MEKELSNLMPFLDGDGRLTQMPAKYKKKLTALWYLSGKIEPGRQYTESEINDLLDEWAVFHDHATLRRELYNKRLLNRTADGKFYWREPEIPALGDFLMKNLC
ncbi:MAG: DUF2087 domain-containing protein [Eubacteriales bacterium]|nr:DUF2087 domain-containing protein [Eubacteriales bacterium]